MLFSISFLSVSMECMFVILKSWPLPKSMMPLKAGDRIKRENRQGGKRDRFAFFHHLVASHSMHSISRTVGVTWTVYSANTD